MTGLRVSETQHANGTGTADEWCVLTGPIVGISHRLARLPETDPWRRRPRCWKRRAVVPKTVLGLRLLDESRRAQLSSHSLHFGFGQRGAVSEPARLYRVLENESGRTFRSSFAVSIG